MVEAKVAELTKAAQGTGVEASVGRQKFEYNGQLVYEWDQTLDDVNIYIKPPRILIKKYQHEFVKSLKPGEKLPTLEVKIAPTHLTIGIKGNPPFLNVNSGFYDVLGGAGREGEHIEQHVDDRRRRAAHSTQQNV